MAVDDDYTRLSHMRDFARQAVGICRNKTPAYLDRDELPALAVARFLEIIGEDAPSV